MVSFGQRAVVSEWLLELTGVVVSPEAARRMHVISGHVSHHDRPSVIANHPSIRGIFTIPPSLAITKLDVSSVDTAISVYNPMAKP